MITEDDFALIRRVSEVGFGFGLSHQCHGIEIGSTWEFYLLVGYPNDCGKGVTLREAVLDAVAKAKQRIEADFAKVDERHRDALKKRTDALVDLNHLRELTE